MRRAPPAKSPSGSQAGILETLAGTDPVSLVTTDALISSAAACASASVCADYFGRKTSGASTSTSYLAYLTGGKVVDRRGTTGQRSYLLLGAVDRVPHDGVRGRGPVDRIRQADVRYRHLPGRYLVAEHRAGGAGTSPSGVIGLACPADDACVVATEPDSAHRELSAQPAQTVRGHQEAGAVALRRMVVRSGRAHSHPDHRPAVDAVPTRCGLGRRCEVDRRGPRRLPIAACILLAHHNERIANGTIAAGSGEFAPLTAERKRLCLAIVGWIAATGFLGAGIAIFVMALEQHARSVETQNHGILARVTLQASRTARTA